MQNQVRLSHRSWPTVAALLLLAACFCPAWTGTSRAAQTKSPSFAPTILQGRVTDIQKDSITIRTPDIRPTPVPGGMTPMYIIAGSNFKVDISHAAFESPIGLPNAQNDLKVGDNVVVACDAINMAAGTKTFWPVTAHVVEKLQIPASR